MTNLTILLSIASYVTIISLAMITVYEQMKTALNPFSTPKDVVRMGKRDVAAEYVEEMTLNRDNPIPYRTYLGSTMTTEKFDNPFSEEAEAHYRKEFTDKHQCDDTCYYDCMEGCEQGEFYYDALEGALRRFSERSAYEAMLGEGVPGQDDAEGPNPWADEEDDTMPDHIYVIDMEIIDGSYFLVDSDEKMCGPYDLYQTPKDILDLCFLHGIDLMAYGVYSICCFGGMTHDEAIKHAILEYNCRRNVVEVIHPNNKSINL